jgi:hypothetical protein
MFLRQCAFPSSQQFLLLLSHVCVCVGLCERVWCVYVCLCVCVCGEQLKAGVAYMKSHSGRVEKKQH